MTVNKYLPHVRLISEDDKIRQCANGFLTHHAIKDAVVAVESSAGGWLNVVNVFETELIPYLRKYAEAHVVLLIDFDGFDDRRAFCEVRVPADLKCRTFLFGPLGEVEDVHRDLKCSYEEIGAQIAASCTQNRLWQGVHLTDNQAELQRMLSVLRPIVCA